MDFISISVKGTVTSVPVRKGKDYSFTLRNERGKYIADFKVIVKNDERPIDINKGDKISIINGGFFIADNVNTIAVIDSSYLSIERVRCNNGIEEV